MWGIRARLNGLGIPTPGRRHQDAKRTRGEWSTATLHYILKREAYIGTWYFGKRKGQREYNPKSHWLPVEVPPIVSKEIWNAAQKRMSKNKNCAPRNLKYETEYLLRRRLKCDACGTYISCKLNRGVCGTKRYHYYRCHAALSKHSYIHPCYVPSFRADQVDSLVWEWLKSLILDEENLIRGVKNHQRELEERSRPLVDRLNVIDGLLDKNKDKLEEVLDLYLDGDFNKEILVERSNRLEKTIEKLNIERSEIELKLSTSTMTDGQIEEITNYTTYIREGIDIANADFYVRRRIVELLNVTGKLCPEDDRKIVEIECILGEKESLDLTEFKAAQSNMVDSVQHP